MKYLFFTSFLKVKGKKLPTENDLEKMISSPLDQSLEVLKNTIYGEISAVNFEKKIDSDRKDDLEELKKLELDEKVIDLIFLKEDLINISFVIKKELFNFNIPLKKEEEELLKKRYPDLVVKEFNSPPEVDNFLADFYFKEMTRKANEIGAKNLKKFLKEYRETPNDSEKKNLEENFIKEAEKEISGVDPIFAFFLRKKIIEKELRNIISGKRLGLTDKEIRNKRNMIKVVSFN